MTTGRLILSHSVKVDYEFITPSSVTIDLSQTNLQCLLMNVPEGKLRFIKS
jgi:hypothetical protein